MNEDGQGDDQLMGAVKGGLLGGAIAGFVGLAMARGGGAEIAIGIVAFFGIAGLVIRRRATTTSSA